MSWSLLSLSVSQTSNVPLAFNAYTWSLGIITGVFVFATTIHIIFGWGLKTEFLVIPIATLFTVTQLRSTLPGAPEFGTPPHFVIWISYSKDSPRDNDWWACWVNSCLHSCNKTTFTSGDYTGLLPCLALMAVSVCPIPLPTYPSTNLPEWRQQFQCVVLHFENHSNRGGRSCRNSVSIFDYFRTSGTWLISVTVSHYFDQWRTTTDRKHWIICTLS